MQTQQDTLTLTGKSVFWTMPVFSFIFIYLGLWLVRTDKGGYIMTFVVGVMFLWVTLQMWYLKLWKKMSYADLLYEIGGGLPVGLAEHMLGWSRK